MAGDRSIFASFAACIDGFFSARFKSIGFVVGSQPRTCIGVSLLVTAIFCGGFSRIHVENRSDKLWVPQGTRSQMDEATFTEHFPPATRVALVLMEAKAPNAALTKEFLEQAMVLHEKIEDIESEVDGLKDTLRTLCVPRPGTGHPCMINSVLAHWKFNSTILAADPDPLKTLNTPIPGRVQTKEDWQSFLGGATFDSQGKLVTAQAITSTYFMQAHRIEASGGYKDPRAEAWETEFLKVLQCENADCSSGSCACGYQADSLRVFPQATRSFGDAFSEVVKGDLGLVNGAFLIMIVYLVLNLGGLCHKVKSRGLLALACTFSIVAAGGAGYGLSMWLGFDFTPVHNVLPFVILGIGVDDSFVIMNALDRTDKRLPIADRVADAMAHAGVSIMVTSLTDFVAFAISISSALPALSTFCMYSAFCVLLLFIFQITMFTPMAALDLQRQDDNLIDCCPCCLPRGCPCCPTVPQAEAQAAIDAGEKDPNQMCGCTPSAHEGGVVGKFLEFYFAPFIVKTPVAVGVIVAFTVFCGICAWQASLTPVEAAENKFIPDGSYLMGTMEKTTLYFGSTPTRFDIMTLSGDYHDSQKALVNVEERLKRLEYVVEPRSPVTFTSWAADFKAFTALAPEQGGLKTAVSLNAEGFVEDKAQYYAALSEWLKLPRGGARYGKDLIWLDPEDPSKGIAASRMAANIKSKTKEIAGRTIVDAMYCVDAMEAIRAEADSWNDFPGNKAIAYTYKFSSWETFAIIANQMYTSVAQCLLAVLLITGFLIAHPVTAMLVFVCVFMAIVDILGCMYMWGLAIDAVTVIQLVIAVGLSVDYAAHVGHSFMMKTGTRKTRVIKVLGDVGAAVLSGGISTFLGIMLLGLSKSYVFRVMFQCFFLTVVLGVAHGMILLPAMLSLIGPASYHTEGDEAKPFSDPNDIELRDGEWAS